MTWRPISEYDVSMGSVIVASRDYADGYIVGEAYLSERDGKWWWAGTDYGDYLANPIDGRVNLFVELPEPPNE